MPSGPACRQAHCLLCGQILNPDLALSLGNLPPCNRFSDPDGATHALSVTECSRCNLVQLLDFPSPEFVRPRYPWIRYNEPTHHLADLAEQLRQSMSVAQPVLTGVGPFDGPLLDCTREWSESAQVLDVTPYLPDEAGRFPYLESFQAILRPEPLTRIATEQGQADLVVCRYLLEHSHDPLASLRGLGRLLNERGLLLIEIPDSTKFLHAGDYSFIWEEHLCYFTESSMRLMAAQAGYAVEQVLRYPGALEDALVFLLRPSDSPITEPVDPEHSSTFEHMRAGLEPLRLRYREAIGASRQQAHKVAIFGAGHQAIMFINALGLQEQIDYVIDDAPDKIGQIIPGTSIRIVSSAVLSEDQQLTICLLALAPAVEAKIRIKHAAFCERGGRMHTIFPGPERITLIDSIE